MLTLFVGHAGIGLSDLTSPLPLVLFAVLVATVALGNLFPCKVSFLPRMRYYAGNWDTTQWCLKLSALEKIDNGLVSIASMPQSQLEKIYGSPEQAEVMLYSGYAFRSMNTHGRALFTLVERAMPAGHQDEYVVTEGAK